MSTTANITVAEVAEVKDNFIAFIDSVNTGEITVADITELDPDAEDLISWIRRGGVIATDEGLILNADRAGEAQTTGKQSHRPDGQKEAQKNRD
jgi:hypothetical protein